MDFDLFLIAVIKVATAAQSRAVSIIGDCIYICDIRGFRAGRRERDFHHSPPSVLGFPFVVVWFGWGVAHARETVSEQRIFNCLKRLIDVVVTSMENCQREIWRERRPVMVQDRA